MRITITGRNIELTPGIKEAVEDKLSKLEKYANVSEVVREATCDEDIIDYFKDNNSSFYDSIL